MSTFATGDVLRQKDGKPFNVKVIALGVAGRDFEFDNSIGEQFECSDGDLIVYIIRGDGRGGWTLDTITNIGQYALDAIWERDPTWG